MSSVTTAISFCHNCHCSFSEGERLIHYCPNCGNNLSHTLNDVTGGVSWCNQQKYVKAQEPSNRKEKRSMKHRKTTFVEVVIVSAIVVTLALTIFANVYGRIGNTPTGPEAESKPKLVHTDSRLNFSITSTSELASIHPKVFFKTTAGQLYNIHHMLRVNDTWMHGDYGIVQLTEVEKVRFEEWIDSWGVLTQEGK